MNTSSTSVSRRVVGPVAALSLCVVLGLSACADPAAKEASTPSNAPSASADSQQAARESASPTSAVAASPTTASVVGDCTAAAVSRDLGRAYDHVSDCDGTWGYAALKVEQPVGDTSVVIHYRDGKWEKLTSIPVSDPELCEENLRAQGMPERFFGVGVFAHCAHGEQRPKEPVQGQPHDQEQAQAGAHANSDADFYRPWWGDPEMGVPWKMGSNGQPLLGVSDTGEVSAVALADGTVATEQYPGCDGRGIVIVDSYIETPGADNQQGLASMLNAHPGAAFVRPGYCASLRGSVDGKRVYPIYYDFGFNHANLCEGKARLGGNARLLWHEPDFRDPCS